MVLLAKSVVCIDCFLITVPHGLNPFQIYDFCLFRVLVVG